MKAQLHSTTRSVFARHCTPKTEFKGRSLSVGLSTSRHNLISHQGTTSFLVYIKTDYAGVAIAGSFSPPIRRRAVSLRPIAGTWLVAEANPKTGILP